MPSVIFVLSLLVALLVLGLWDLMGKNDELRAQLASAEKLRNSALEKAIEKERSCAELVGQLSGAKNTIALMMADQAKGKKVEPIKARSAAEVRKAVERRNFEEMNDGRSEGSKDSVSEDATGRGPDSSARGA